MALLSSVTLAGDTHVFTLLNAVVELPMKDEQISDKAYLELLNLGASAVPDLVAAITSEKAIKDPRPVPHNEQFRIGDLAHIVLCKITKRDFEDALPKNVRSRFVSEGVSAYFEYVRIPKNRKKLQANWRIWLDNHK